MCSSLRVASPFLQDLANLALWPYDNNGYGGARKRVSGHRSNTAENTSPAKSKDAAHARYDTALASCTHDNRVRAVERDKAVKRRRRTSSNELQDDGQFSLWVVFDAFVLYLSHQFTRFLANKLVILVEFILVDSSEYDEFVCVLHETFEGPVQRLAATLIRAGGTQEHTGSNGAYIAFRLNA